MAPDIIHEIANLYRELPEVSCKGCGQCCVAPTCTLSEWIYLFHNLLAECPTTTLERYLNKPAVPHAGYDGNVHCPFLDGKRCAVHPMRTGACRLFGVPGLNQLGVQNLEKCKQHCDVISGDGSPHFINAWLEKLTALDISLYAFDTGPYYITGFSIQCWNDIYFNDALNFDIFIDIKNAMTRYCDLSFFKHRYSQKTGIKEKIDKIGIFSTILGSGDTLLLREILTSIKDDYPETGTYFYEEASAFLARLDQP